MVTTEILPCLAQTSLFAGVPMDVLADVAGKLSYHQYPPGEMIVWQGEPSSMVYVITRGIATVTRLVPGSQRTTTLAYLMPQQSFGEIGFWKVDRVQRVSWHSRRWRSWRCSSRTFSSCCTATRRWRLRWHAPWAIIRSTRTGDRRSERSLHA